MAGLINESKYETMKKEFKEVVQVFFDDTQNAQQTVQLISEIAGAAISVQGLSEVHEGADKAKIVGLMLMEIGTEIAHDKIVGDPEVV